MSGRRLKQLLSQSAELDDLIQAAKGDDNATKVEATQTNKKSKSRSNQKSSSSSSSDNDSNSKNKNETEIKLQSQLDSILFFDHAFSRRAGSNKKSMKRKMDEIKNVTDQRKKIKSSHRLNGSTGNSRSSSSMNSRRKNIPTYNKKKDQRMKRIKNLKELARKLKKRNT